MDLQQAKSLINKINALFKGIESGDNMLSAIERDLMLSYIRQLYEEFLNIRAEMPAAKSPTRSAEGESAQPEFEVIVPKAPAAPQKKPSKPRIIEIPDSLKNMEPPPPKPKVVAKDPAPPPPKREPVQPKPASPKPVPASPKNTNLDLEEEYNVLFEFKEAKELSEKLSERRVDDLGKALAINDRLQFMNELFGKDASMLNETLKLLNKFDSIGEAKGLLINLAERYDWLDQEKRPVAQGFIKLVRRKYI